MNTGAELTLQVIRLAQAHARGDGAPFPDRWVFWPGGERLDWAGARELLGGLAKPLLIAPLLEPGMLGLWTLDSIDAAHRSVIGRGISNQVQYYADKLTTIPVEQGLVQFGSGTSSHEMTRGEFLQWATEYAINIGISLAPSGEATGVTRVLVRPSGGRGPPLTV